MKRKVILLLAALNVVQWAGAQITSFKENFDKTVELRTVGRGECRSVDGVLRSKDSYACFGDHGLKDYMFSFKARTPKDAEQVQIWAGFRSYNRFDRYVVGVKGGLQDDIYLMRTGYMGTDEFLSMRPLDFHPVPGVWYDIKVEVCGPRIRVFINNDSAPRIDVIDKNSNLAPSGEVTLGGGWIETEFDDLVISPMNAYQLEGIKVEEYKKVVTAQNKEEQRLVQRAQYQPVKVAALTDSRIEVSLDGNWLFMPEYQLDDKNKAISLSTNDTDWHIMSVPDFWNPIRIWLHGETMGPFPKGVSDTYYQQETNRCEGYSFDFRKTKAAWYRQWVELPEGVFGKNMTFTFDAVSKVAEVYINGQTAGSHIGMFGEFKVDGSRLLKPGKNLVVVKVTRDFIKNINDADKIVDVAVTVPVTNKMLKDIAHGFYCDDPAGIWQPVKLTITDPLKIEDVFIKPSLDGATFDVTVKNHHGKKNRFNLYTDIIDKETKSVLYTGQSLQKITLNGNEEKMLSYTVTDLKPRLWTPQHPNLYEFKFRVTDEKGRELDSNQLVSGFRTFEVKDGLFYLNGHAYWLRGGNHTPFALAPNDKNLATTFYQLMKAGNIDITRTHTTPYNKLWMNAADVNGIGISFEGTWPWLMIQSSMPDAHLIEMWKEEFLGLLKKYRNHPSLLFWTVNNEMKFYDNEPNRDKAKKKMLIISDVVKEMRKIDPTRPISFDSNYRRKGRPERFGNEFMATIDDGDIDDVHSYINWYDYNIFREFNGAFQSEKTKGRPLISQEMSTGYPNNETGHPTRSYQLLHQNPQCLVGYEAYDWCNPASFLKTQSFVTGELAEALRRSCDQASGIMHFALLTWFRSVYDYQKIDPYPTYYALQRALQPVLITAELWGRHFYAGEQLPVRLCVVNDREDGSNVQASRLVWKILDKNGEIGASGIEQVPSVKHYGRYWFTPKIRLPKSLSSGKENVKLLLELKENGLVISSNEYELLVADKSWNRTVAADKRIVLFDKNNTRPAFDAVGLSYHSAFSIQEMLQAKADICVLAGDVKLTADEQQLLHKYMAIGGKLLLLQGAETAKNLFPDYILSWVKPTEGEIVSMEIPESPIFDGIEKLELRNFNNNQRENPNACDASLTTNRDENVIELASQIKIHGYIDGTMEARVRKMKASKGFTLLKIVEDKGVALVSTMCTTKAITDPIAGKLLVNMINELK